MQNTIRRGKGESARSESGIPPAPKSSSMKKIGRFAISPPLVVSDNEGRRGSIQSNSSSDGSMRNSKQLIEVGTDLHI
jgi:hypothetical protein